MKGKTMTEQERKQAHYEWLEFYTWIQEDESIDFSHPRCRPLGLPIHPMEEF